MKQISRLLIVCLLLCGCSGGQTAEPPWEPPEETAAPHGLYDTASSLEISSLGALKVFPLSPRTGKGILPFGDGILLFSGGEHTTLTLFTGDTLVPTARKNLEFSLEPSSCSQHGERLSYYDPVNRQTVVLDTNLEVITTISAPPGVNGAPVLSPEGSILYYSTSTAIRAWDLDTGIHRILRQTPHTTQTITRLSFVGSILRCDGEDTCFFLSPETGQLLAEADSSLKLAATEDGFLAASWETNLWSFVFQSGDETKALTPRSLSSDYFLLEGSMSVVTATASREVVTLDYYDLVTGQRTASQMIRGSAPQSVVNTNGELYVLMTLPEYDGQAILRWDTSRSPVSDRHIYTGPHFTEENPDREGLTKCQNYANQIGQRYGLNILIWRSGAALAPDGIAVKAEHRVNILMRELELLDQRLSQFPEGLLQTTAANFASMNIGLVAQIRGGIQESSLQVFSGQDANILLTVGGDSESELYHQIFHVMQTHILSHSSAFDQWDTLNPPGFQYDYDYAANAIRNSGIYLAEDNRFFVDTFSMSYPREDQARVFEYAMMPGTDAFFHSKSMQKKLKAVCLGLREAYRLPVEGIYLWEQYLK